MFCGECGTQNPDTNQFCKNCGKPLRRPQQAPAPQQTAVPVPPVAVPAPAQPVYYPPPPAGAQPQAVPQAAPPGYVLVPVASPTEKLLTVAGIIGFIVSLVSWVRYPYICGIAAIVLGALVFFKSGNRKRKGVIIAVLGLIIGLASILVDFFYLSIFPPQAVIPVIFWMLH